MAGKAQIPARAGQGFQMTGALCIGTQVSYPRPRIPYPEAAGN